MLHVFARATIEIAAIWLMLSSAVLIKV